jgi:hypothetical protein
MMRRWEYTSDETGACVSKFAAQVVRDVNRESSIRVCVRRGDGKKLVEMLRSGLPNTNIELTCMSSSMGAKFDVSVQVWEGQNERLVWELCNVERRAVVAPWTRTLKAHYEWAKNHNTTAPALLMLVKPLEVCLRLLLGYGSRWWAALERDEFKERLGACQVALDSLRSFQALCGSLLQDKPDDANLLRYQSATEAGIDAAEEIINNAEKARKK